MGTGVVMEGCSSKAIHKATILIVDDSPDNLLIIAEILKSHYRVRVASNGEKALRIATSAKRPDLILLDVLMPGMDGYALCRRLSEMPQTRLIPVIFLTSKTDATDETHGFSLGAVDYIAKPINPDVLLARVRTHLQVKSAADFLRDQNAYLEQEVAKRTAEIGAIQKATILSLASLAETRDSDTGGHLWRTQQYVYLLARHLQNHPRFSSSLTEKFIQMVFDSAPLHDIGKVGIPDQVLLKADRLTAQEFEVIKTHTLIGYKTILHAEKSLGVPVQFLKVAQEIILSHHEKWDGSGYPDQLAGEQIPVSARLMALADVYDSLISSRVYRKAMTHEQVVEIILEGRATHFDPDIVDAFVCLQEQFREISRQCADGMAWGNYRPMETASAAE